MSQEAITEIDMDVFSRRIGPYFSWLESRIESGWQQNDSVQKDVLKEVKYLATTMRARFILGVTREDFAKEVQRAVELFELAQEAFNGESDEVESKLKHFCKGVQEELGAQFLPPEYRTESPRPQPLDPHPFPTPEPMPGPEPDEPEEPEEPEEQKISKVAPAKPKAEAKKPVVAAPKVEMKKVEAPKVEVKVAKPKAKKVEAPKIKTAPVKKTEPKQIKAKPAEKPRKSGKRFFLVRWVKGFIWGDE
jgi:hypothetical protein